VASLAEILGIRIEFRDEASDAAAGLDLGATVSASDVLAAIDFDLLIPVSVGPPDAFHLRPGPQAWLVWEPTDSLPPIPETSAGLILAEFRANPEEESIVKLANAGVEVISVDVNGEQGFWLEGGPHTVLFDLGDYAEASRSTGNVLLWTDGPITYRMETSLSMVEALALARDTEPLTGR
jgi:hypothetical protein